MRSLLICLLVATVVAPRFGLAQVAPALSDPEREALTEVVIQCRRVLSAAQDGLVFKDYDDPCREALDRWFLAIGPARGTKLAEATVWLSSVDRVRVATAGIILSMGKRLSAKERSAFDEMEARIVTIEASLRSP